MQSHKIRVYLVGLSALLVVLVLLFTGFLNAGSFQKNYVDSLVASNSVAGAEARRKIEYAVRFHKPLQNFAGMSEILAGVKKETPAIAEVYLVLPDGSIANDVRGPVRNVKLPAPLLGKARLSESKVEGEVKWQAWDGQYHAFLPIRDASGHWIGTLDLISDAAFVANKTASYLWTNIKFMAFIAGLTIFVLAALIYRVELFSAEGEFLKWRLTLLLAGVLGAAQIAYGVINVSLFRSAYMELAQADLALIAGMIARRIGQVIALGIGYGDLLGIDDWLRQISQSVREIGEIEILDTAGKIIYSTVASGDASVTRGVDALRQSLPADVSGAAAVLNLSISSTHVWSQTLNLALDALTMFVTSLFFLAELLVFIGFLLQRQLRRAPIGPARVAHDPSDDGSVRTLAFLLLLSSYMSTSFIPIMMKDFEAPLFGLSPSMALGLPIIADMMGAFLSSLFVGGVIDRHGWRPPFLTGLVVLTIGAIGSAAATDAIFFILARGVSGLGYGAAWMGLRGLVAAGQTGEARVRGFSILNAGIYAGQNCGAVLGAMFAERLGFAAVFVCAAIVAVLASLLAFVLVINVRPSVTGAQASTNSRLGSFFFDRNVFAFFALVTIPAAASNSFLTYFFPLFAESIGVTQGNIGRAFLLYGFCIIFAGPLLIRWINRSFASQQTIVASGFVGAAALGVFWFSPTFVGALVAIFLLGIADAIGLVSQNSYFIGLKAARDLGHGKALSLYSAIKKVGQMSGPGMFGLAGALGAAMGVGVVAAGYAAVTAAYVLASKKGRGADDAQA